MIDDIFQMEGQPIMRALLVALVLILSLVSVAGLTGTGRSGPSRAFAQSDDPDDLATRLAKPRGTEEATDERSDAPGESKDDSPQGVYEGLVEEAQQSDPAFGPESGEIELSDDEIGFYFVDDPFQDFLFSVTIENAGFPSDEFDFGLFFRISGDMNDPVFIMFTIQSTGQWQFYEGTFDEISDPDSLPLKTGRYRDMDDSAAGENEFQIYALGEEVHLAINGNFETTVTVDNERSGGISLIAGLYQGSGGDGDVIEFSDLTVWDLTDN